MPLVITYLPLFKDFASVIRKHLYILSLCKEVKEIFTPGRIDLFGGAKKLAIYLVIDKLYPLERSLGSLAEDRCIVIKKADQGFHVVVCDRLDCLSEAEKELGDKNIYIDFLSVTKCFVIW